MIYAIYEDFFPEVEKKLNRIAKKCVKHGNDFIFRINGEEIRENFNTETEQTEYYKFVLVEVEGTAKINNWECIAVLEAHNSGNIIRRINTDIIVPERFQTSKNICEHCNSKRQRNNLYIIHNTDTDEWKQVGGSCLKLYTNGLNMEYIVAFLDGITTLEENNGIFASGKKVYHSVKDVLAYAVEVIAKTGYFNAQSSLPTKCLVNFCVNYPIVRAIDAINEELAFGKYDVRFWSGDFHKKDTYETVEKIMEYYKNLEDSSEFIHNVQVMLHEGYVRPQNIGFICYLPEGYAKHVQKEIEKAKRIESKYFGEVGKRYKDKVIQFVNLVTSWETQYGYTYIYKITLEDGTILTSFTC